MEIRVLAKHGLGVREIAREVGVSPDTPFKLNQDRRQHIPRQTHKVTNSLGALLRRWPAYEAGLRQRVGLTLRVPDHTTLSRRGDAAGATAAAAQHRCRRRG